MQTVSKASITMRDIGPLDST